MSSIFFVLRFVTDEIIKIMNEAIQQKFVTVNWRFFVHMELKLFDPLFQFFKSHISAATLNGQKLARMFCRKDIKKYGIICQCIFSHLFMCIHLKKTNTKIIVANCLHLSIYFFLKKIHLLNNKLEIWKNAFPWSIDNSSQVWLKWANTYSYRINSQYCQ